MRVVTIVAGLLAAGAAFAQQAPLPRQDIVLVIDNSSSMDRQPDATDPLRLRAVAGDLVLDAADVSSDVQAGLVIFSDDVDSDRKLNPPSVIRRRLAPDHFPPTGGGTNMYDALNTAIGMFTASTAEIKRIVLITDGVPNAGQPEKILSSLVPLAQHGNVQIFAIGLSGLVNQQFLEKVTQPTGGKTLIALHHQELLRAAKRLMGNQDNVSNPLDTVLPAGRNEYAFTVRPGTDRARLTVILDHPREFTTGEIRFSVTGPAVASEMTYATRTEKDDRVAAWTAFFNSPGAYTLHVDAPRDHGGLRLFLEELADLRVAVRLDPELSRYQFGDTVKVHVTTTNASGAVADASLRITGTEQTAAGGTNPIAFSGSEGQFRVAGVAGTHTVIVKASTTGSDAEKRVTYEVLPPAPVAFSASPAKPSFAGPLGPTATTIDAPFKLVPEFSEEAKPHAVKVAFLTAVPVGEAEIVMADGSAHPVNGPAFLTVPPEGEELKLRIKLDPKRPLPRKGEHETAELRVVSGEGPDLSIPIEYDVRLPQFDVKSPRSSFSLWWDSAKARVIRIGTVHTDLELPSTFTVTIPESILYPKRGTKVAGLELLVDGKKFDAEPASAGRIRYGPIDLPAGHDAPLDLLVEPRPDTGWQLLPAAQSAIDVDVTSSYGMNAKVTISMSTGRSYGRVVATVLIVGLVLLIVALLAVARFGNVLRFHAVRAGRILPIGFGAVTIGDTASAAVALALPNSGSELDDDEVGSIVRDGRRQRVDNNRGRLVVTRPLLAPNDTLAIVADPESDPLWEMRYVGPLPGEGGEVEISATPAVWTLGTVVRRLVFGLTVAALLFLFLRTDFAAALAYRLPL